MATSQLLIYQGALREIGERRLASLAVGVGGEPRRVLDDAWPNLIGYILEQGFWRCSLRTTKLEPDPSVTTEFGFANAYAIPTDWLRTYKMASDPYLRNNLKNFDPEGRHWYGDLSEIYVSYVSNSTSYGADLSLWSTLMARYAELLLASWVVDRVKPTQDAALLSARAKQALDDALAKDAMESPTEFMPTGTWSKARYRG